MTPPVEIRPAAHRPTRRSLRATQVGAVLAAVAVTSLVFLLVVAAFRDPVFVDRVRIENPSGYDIRVDIADSDVGGRMLLGVAGQHCTTEFNDVIDPGSTWVVRFATQGRDGGAITVARSELERSGWTLRVPDEVVQRFAVGGAPLAPRHSCAAP